MGERRKARRYEVFLPVQVFNSRRRAEAQTGQLRDISRSGIFFHSSQPMEEGATLELTFALPAGSETSSVLVRVSAKALRVSRIIGEKAAPLFGIAACFDRIDFVRPAMSAA